MSCFEYIKKRFKSKSLDLIETCNQIIEDYQGQGYTLTVRQLYYQLVSRNVIANNEKSYKCVVGTVNDGRMAGLIDWDAIEDRTRAFIRRNSWGSPKEIVSNAARGFHMDMWDNQPNRVFVVIEKEALVNVFERECFQYDVPLLAARGYPSASVLEEFGREHVYEAEQRGQHPVVLHFGDHDPSGLDMSRDLESRIKLFSLDAEITFERLALNMDQIKTRKPPPNPAKSTDARFRAYKAQYGTQSWELDALPPDYLAELTRDAITSYIDDGLWDEKREEIEDGRAKILKLVKQL